MKPSPFVATLALPLALAAPVLAQGGFTIVDGTAIYTQGPLTAATSTGPLCDLRTESGAGATDYLLQMAWWYGIGLDRVREFTFSPANLVSSETNRNTNTQVFDVGDFRASVVTTIESSAPGRAIVTQTLTCTNLSDAPLPIDFFHYVDPSYGGDPATDTAADINRFEIIRVRDLVNNSSGEYMGLFNINHQAGTAPVVRNLLSNAFPNFFQGVGLPYSSLDLSYGFQFRFSFIPVRGSRSCTAVFTVGTGAPYIPNGACALSNNDCVQATAHDCETRNGTFLGVGTRCPTICPCDWNNNGALNSQDFFDFLADFFSGPADYNQDQFTNSQDYFDFVTCFFTAPGVCFP